MSLRLTAVLILTAAPRVAAEPQAVTRARQTLHLGGLPIGGDALARRLSREPLGPDAVRTLIGRLASRSFRDRQAATRRLVAAGDSALSLLQAATGSRDPEVARRARRVLANRRNLTPAQEWAAARVLAHDRPAGYARALLSRIDIAGAGRRDRLIDAAAPALADSAPAQRTLREWLGEASAGRRFAAGVLLAGRHAVARKLLADPVGEVRHAVTLALLRNRDRAALPHVTEVLTEGTPDRALRAEESLRRLKRDGPPPALLNAPTVESRQKASRFWEGWLASHKVDLGDLGRPPVPLGRLVVAEYGRREVRCRGWDGVTHWWFGANGPYQVKPLPAGLLLVCEWGGRAVSVRDRGGARRWYAGPFDAPPVAAQALPDGCVFVATQKSLFVVDHDGNRVQNILKHSPLGEIADARLRDDGTAVYMTPHHIVELDSDGRELKRLRPVGVGVLTAGRLHPLPRGYLVCDTRKDRVVELDRAGKPVRSFRAAALAAARPLPGGGFLVTGHTGYAAQWDQAGKPLRRLAVSPRTYWTFPE